MGKSHQSLRELRSGDKLSFAAQSAEYSLGCCDRRAAPSNGGGSGIVPLTCDGAPREIALGTADMGAPSTPVRLLYSSRRGTT